MRKSIVILSSFLLIFSSVKGQGFDSGGLIIDPSTITAFDMFETSQTQFGFGTARSAAMAGAMTSLGGDASSLSINPAGLGMYRSNEISITPYMSFSKSTTNAAAFEGDKKNRFSIGGLSFIAKIRESSTGVMAINMGLAYTRLADYNYKYSFATTGGAAKASIADVFAGQLAASGMTSSGLKENYDAGGYFRWDAIDPTYWGAVLGYKTGLVGDNGREIPHENGPCHARFGNGGLLSGVLSGDRPVPQKRPAKRKRAGFGGLPHRRDGGRVGKRHGHPQKSFQYLCHSPGACSGVGVAIRISPGRGGRDI